MGIKNLSYKVGEKHLEYLNKVVRGQGRVMPERRKLSRYDKIKNYFTKVEDYEMAIEMLTKNKDFFDTRNSSRIHLAKKIIENLNKRSKSKLEYLVENGHRDSMNNLYKKIKDPDYSKQKLIRDLNTIVEELHYFKKKTYGKDSTEIKGKIQGAIRKTQEYRNNKFTRVYDEHIDNKTPWVNMNKIKTIAYGKDKRYREYKERFSYLREFVSKNFLFNLNDLDELRAIKRSFVQNRYLDKKQDYNPLLKKEREKTINYIHNIIVVREETIIPLKKAVEKKIIPQPVIEPSQRMGITA